MVFSPNGSGQLKIIFRNGPNIVKIVTFSFYDTEIDQFAVIISRKVWYQVFEDNTLKTISKKYYAEIYSDGANALFGIYEKEGGVLIFSTILQP